MSVFAVVMAILVGVVCGLRLNGFLRRTGDLCCTVPVSRCASFYHFPLFPFFLDLSFLR